MIAHSGHYFFQAEFIIMDITSYQASSMQLMQLRMLKCFCKTLFRGILYAMSPESTFETLLLCKLAAKLYNTTTKSKASYENGKKNFGEKLRKTEADDNQSQWKPTYYCTLNECEFLNRITFNVFSVLNIIRFRNFTLLDTCLHPTTF